jgi:ABC-type multidrug transport system fused ATPase/permease subunit
MNPDKYKTLEDLLFLWRLLNGRRKLQFLAVLFLMVLSSFAEMLNIGGILYFLRVLTEPEKLFSDQRYDAFFQIFGIQSTQELMVIAAILFGFITLTANLSRLIALWGGTRLSFAVGCDLAGLGFKKLLFQEYIYYASQNTSQLINGITYKVNAAAGCLSNFLNLINAVILTIAILIAIMYVNMMTAILAFLGFFFIYMLVIRLTRKKLESNGLALASSTDGALKILQEGFGGIRDILIDGTQDKYINIYNMAEAKSRRAQGNIAIIGASPRYIVETLAMMLILLLTIFLTKNLSGISSVLPILGALALGAQRLLPVLQTAYVSWSNIQGNKALLGDALKLLSLPMPLYAVEIATERIVFGNSLKLVNLSFQYSTALPFVLSGVNLLIHKGERIGIIGKTGGGKSTLIDIVMGLLTPTEGTISVDDVAINQVNRHAWQKNIAHVPQAIYLTDSSIAENIALGMPGSEIDMARVSLAADKAQLADFINTLPYGYKTNVGERGVRLSGGQRQRMGIARALYKDANVLIFDEATSSLDAETESSVMASIEGLTRDLTIFIVAHRHSTLQGCDRIIEVSDKKITRIGGYGDFFNGSS